MAKDKEKVIMASGLADTFITDGYRPGLQQGVRLTGGDANRRPATPAVDRRPPKGGTSGIKPASAASGGR